MNICHKNGINTCADKTLQLPYVVMLELHFYLVLIRFLIALNRIQEPSDLQEFGTLKGEKEFFNTHLSGQCVQGEIRRGKGALEVRNSSSQLNK